jgi:hypothetical protein
MMVRLDIDKFMYCVCHECVYIYIVKHIFKLKMRLLKILNRVVRYNIIRAHLDYIIFIL